MSPSQRFLPRPRGRWAAQQLGGGTRLVALLPGVEAGEGTRVEVLASDSVEGFCGVGQVVSLER